jgi:hypothetical protein
MMRLLLDASGPMPPEARRELESQGAPAGRVARRDMAVACFFFLFFMTAMILASGVRSWPLFVAGAVTGVIAPLFAFGAMRRPGVELGRWVFSAVMLSIGFSSFFLGPGVTPPALIGVATMSFIIFGERQHRTFFIAGAAVTVLVPFALQALGWIPDAYSFTSEGMLVRPILTNLPRVPTLVFMAAFGLSLAVLPALMSTHARDALNASEERVFMHAYRLRQLVPDAARMAAGVPVPPPPRAPICPADVGRFVAERAGVHHQKLLRR